MVGTTRCWENVAVTQYGCSDLRPRNLSWRHTDTYCIPIAAQHALGKLGEMMNRYTGIFSHKINIYYFHFSSILMLVPYSDRGLKEHAFTVPRILSPRAKDGVVKFSLIIK